MKRAIIIGPYRYEISETGWCKTLVDGPRLRNDAMELLLVHEVIRLRDRVALLDGLIDNLCDAAHTPNEETRKAIEEVDR